MPSDSNWPPLPTVLVDAWTKLEKTLPVTLKTPQKLPTGKPMDAEQAKALLRDVTGLFQKMGSLAPKLAQVQQATSFDAVRPLLVDLEKRTASATKQIQEFRKPGGPRTVVGNQLFAVIDKLHAAVLTTQKNHLATARKAAGKG